MILQQARGVGAQALKILTSEWQSLRENRQEARGTEGRTASGVIDDLHLAQLGY